MHCGPARVWVLRVGAAACLQHELESLKIATRGCDRRELPAVTVNELPMRCRGGWRRLGSRLLGPDLGGLELGEQWSQGVEVAIEDGGVDRLAVSVADLDDPHDGRHRQAMVLLHPHRQPVLRAGVLKVFDGPLTLGRRVRRGLKRPVLPESLFYLAPQPAHVGARAVAQHCRFHRAERRPVGHFQRTSGDLQNVGASADVPPTL